MQVQTVQEQVKSYVDAAAFSISKFKNKVNTFGCGVRFKRILKMSLAVYTNQACVTEYVAFKIF